MGSDGLHRGGVAGFIQLVRGADQRVIHCLLRLRVVSNLTNKGVQQAMQQQRLTLILVEQAQRQQAVQGVLRIQTGRRIFQVTPEGGQQQISGKGFARSQAGGTGQQVQGVGVD